VRHHAVHDLPHRLGDPDHLRGPVQRPWLQLVLPVEGRDLLRRPSRLGALRMSFSDMILIGAAVFAVIGALGAFTIAFRRSQQAAARRRPAGGPSAETLRADRSLAGVRVAPAPVVASEPEQEAEPEPEPEPEPAGEPELEPVGVRLVEVQRVIEVSPEEAGVTRRQFFNRAMNAGFFAFLGLMGMGSLSMFWPKISGGFGSDVDAGSVGDLQSQTVTPDGSVAPVFVPEARAYVV